MPRQCCIIGCRNISDENGTLSFYGIPKIPKRQNKRSELAAKRRNLWLSRISRNSSSNPNYWKVCMKHFITGAPANLYDTSNPDWAPSLNLGHSKFMSLERCERAIKRQKQAANMDAATSLLLLQQQSHSESGGALQPKDPKEDGGAALHPEDENTVAPHSEGPIHVMSEPKKPHYYCFVPQCKNTTVSTPEKMFLSVPRDKEIRKLWWLAARRQFPVRYQSIYCCEDHFDIEESIDNYLYVKLMGGRVILKKGVVPHKFHCQGRLKPPKENCMVLKKKTIQEILQEKENMSESTPTTSSETQPDDKHTASLLEPHIKHMGIQKRFESSRMDDVLPEEHIKAEMEQIDVKEEPIEEEEIPLEEEEIPQDIMTPVADITIIEEDIPPAIKTGEEDILPDTFTEDPLALTPWE